MNPILLTVALYLLILFSIVLLTCRKQNIESYFLNKRGTSLLFMIFSNVATLIGAGAVVIVISEAHKGSLAIGFINISTFIIAILILGFMAGKIRDIGEKHKISTIVDYFQVRFGNKNRILMVVYQLILLMAWIGIQAMAVSILLSEILGISYFEAIFLVMAVCLLYSMVGGLKADIILDFVQFWVMLSVYLFMGFIAYKHGDIFNMIQNTPKEVLNPLYYKGTAWFVFGAIMISAAYVSSAPHWQRIISADSKETAQKSFFYSAPIVLVITSVILFLGLYAYHHVAGLDNSDKAVFVLMDNLLPAWATGIGYAAIIATVTSSLDSMFVAGSTIVYREFISNRNTKIIKARMITLLFGSLGILSALIFPRLVDLGIFYFSLAAIPAATIIFGMISQKHSANANFYSILIPMILLFALYPLLTSKTFLLTTSLSILIALLYDKIFIKKTV